ncbi:MAG: hypothetical protein QOG14_5254 [Mycobacterium sp.]|jgi:hypothetical protein|nr:hypothetical protein [Mycobacterium sp.]
MAQIPGGINRLRYASGLYAELRDREERAAVVLGDVAAGTYRGTPERLAAVRAGEPIDMPVGDLPRRAHSP